MSRIEVTMPQLGESIAEGTVSVWLKRVGDRVGRDEPILEVSTDKVDAEIPSPAAGTLVEILVPEGETVEVGTVVALLEEGAALVPSAESAPPIGEVEDAAEVSARTDADPKDGAPASVAGAATEAHAAGAAEADPPAPDVRATAEVRTTDPGDGLQSLEQRIRTRSSPLVRRIAEEHHVDLRSVRGSGWMGRVTKRDILGYIRNGGHAEDAVASSGLDWNAFHTQVRHPVVEAGPEDRVEPLSRMTRLIADHMVLSRRISPHVHSIIEVDYSRVDQLRDGRVGRQESGGERVSYTAFIARAVALALREHPKLNASVSGTDAIYRGEVNIGVAVALPWGLIVPVVKRADELSLIGLSERIGDLAERARAKRLDPAEVQDGTFTITNPGVFGTVVGFPIVNQPQVAILGVGGVEKRAVVITDEFGNDAIVARKRGFLSLGFDHRLVNGADADRFLARVKELLETVEDGG